MARIKGGLNAKKRHNRTLKLAKGYRGARSKQYRVAKQSVMRALTSAYAGRKQRKRQMRQLWIARINAAARMNGLSYSKFMHGLKLAEKYSPERLEQVCTRALSYSGKPSYKSIKNLLATMKDSPAAISDESKESQAAPKPHGITRGARYYGGKRS